METTSKIDTETNRTPPLATGTAFAALLRQAAIKSEEQQKQLDTTAQVEVIPQASEADCLQHVNPPDEDISVTENTINHDINDNTQSLEYTTSQPLSEELSLSPQQEEYTQIDDQYDLTYREEEDFQAYTSEPQLVQTYV